MIRIVNLSLCAVVISLLGSVSWANDKNCKDESKYPIVSKKELKELIEKKAVFIVDVNSEKSFKENHVPGAIHYGSHKKDFAQVLPADKNSLIVAYCGGPMCNAWEKAAEAACELGHSKVSHYKGGLKDWLKESSS